ncbi:MAG TPA: ABC transporter permease [Anaerolineaceae bacterium]|jgi:ABC-2 type transport system permease protein|nr:ABC transporter permease [Anaerolineaceae bacterium]
MNNRLRALIRKEFIQVLRDPRTLVLIFVLPVMMLFLLGYAATNDVRNIALAVFDQDNSAASRALLAALRASDYFRTEAVVSSEAELRALMDRNAVRAGVIIPPDYGRELSAGRTGQVAFVIDGSDPTVANTALSAATLAGQSISADILTARLASRGQNFVLLPPVEIRTQVWYNPGLISAHYMIPGMIGIILQFLATLMTATSIVRERERGTIEQLIVTPLRPWELVVGKLTPYVLIAFLDTLEVLFAGVLIFGVPINGSLGLLLALTALFLITTLGIGLLISTIANTQQEAMLTTQFMLLPSIFLSGFFFPLAAMPDFLQWISYVIPLRYFLVIARGVVLKGVGLEAMWPEAAALAVFGLVVMTGAALRFKKRLD